jgi:hypothetical protein
MAEPFDVDAFFASLETMPFWVQRLEFKRLFADPTAHHTVHSDSRFIAWLTAHKDKLLWAASGRNLRYEESWYA